MKLFARFKNLTDYYETLEDVNEHLLLENENMRDAYSNQIRVNGTYQIHINELNQECSLLMENLTQLKSRAEQTLKQLQILFSNYEKQYKQISEAEGDLIGSILEELLYIYERVYQEESLMLRTELLSRLPQKYRKSELNYYKYPTNFLGFKNMINDFATLIKNLPDN